MAGQITITAVKKVLGAAFPDIAFTYGTAGRGRQRGHSVSWIGGPPAEVIRAAVRTPWNAPYHFVRQHTPEEWTALHAQWDAERAARVAAEPARRAAAKAAGIEKRKATAAAKKSMLTKLAAAFPGVDFSIASDITSWTDGPEIDEVATLLGDDRKYQLEHWYRRSQTPAFAAAKAERERAKVHASRLAKRLAASKVRTLRVSRGMARRRLAYAQRLGRLRLDAAQMVLPMDFPIWAKPPIYISFAEAA